MAPGYAAYSDLPETAAQHPAHEGLQTEQPGLQAAQPEKIALQGHQEVLPTSTNFGYDAHHNAHWQQPPEGQQKKRRICGLVAWVFWLVIGTLAVVIVAAAVGGGVAGGLAGKNSSASSSATSATSTAPSSVPISSTSSSSPSSFSAATSTTSTASVTTTTVVGPTSTLLRDCPSANYTLYSIGSQTFRKFCNATLYHAGGEYALSVNVGAQSLDDCIDQCAAYNIQNQSH